VAVGGLFYILNRTRLGVRIRAGTLDLDTVSVLGVNVRVLRTLNFGLGIYLAGLAGVLAAGQQGLSPTLGLTLIMPSFVAIIVGGLGSLPGTLLGGVLIGVASNLTTVYFPSATEAVMYVMMGLVLLIKPSGLLGEEGRVH
ncbi:MAG TPA: branched-chain amino acid ABC transporter permease, partial [Alphaproteobacteria bacterium]